jgi:MFS superfamily sulfate permease-like transporter
MTTETATWSEPTDDDSIDVVSLLAAIIVAMAIAGFTMLRRASDAIVEDGEDEDSDYSKDEY